MPYAFTVTTPRGQVPIELLCGTLKSLKGEDCKVFSVVGNEPYFVPHFLKHYRKLGASRFISYLDRPSENLYQYVINQPDVTAFTSKMSFGTVMGKYSYGALFRWHHFSRPDGGFADEDNRLAARYLLQASILLAVRIDSSDFVFNVSSD